MSAICGVTYFDGRTAAEAELSPMLEVLRARGPEAFATANAGLAALGFARNASTPEALGAVQPLAHESSGAVIVADARLDNRDVLVPLLAPERSQIDDSELILLAYLRWGQDCPRRLVGDFAFALWDPRRQRLFAARDWRGMRQLSYFHRPGSVFVFATDYQAVAEHIAVPKHINEGRIADFLAELEHHNAVETFFSGIFRLEAGHCLAVDRGGLTAWKHHSLDLPPPLKLNSDEDYADALLEQFERSVKRRLRSARPVGAMLSGGLDSSSVCAVAARILEVRGAPALKTFSAINSAGHCAETGAIRRVASQLTAIEPHFVDLADPSLRLDGHFDDPFDCMMVMANSVYADAAAAGINVMIDGGLGDLLLSPFSHVERMLRAGHWITAAREMVDEYRFGRGAWPLAQIALFHSGRALVPASVKRWRRRARLKRAKEAILHDPYFAPGFAARVDLPARLEHIHVRDSSFDRYDDHERLRRIEYFRSTLGIERYNRVAGMHGIETRDPFTDIELTRFCLSLPETQLQSRGFPKAVMRRAMAGLLPEEICWRRGKEHLGAAFGRKAYGGSKPEWLGRSIGSYVGIIPAAGPPDHDPGQQRNAFHAIGLARWLGRFGGPKTALPSEHLRTAGSDKAFAAKDNAL